jgi:hypothetical protein
MARKGLLEVGSEEVNRKSCRILTGFWRATDQDAPRCLSFTGIGKGAGMMHIETEGKHLVVITSELVGVGEISNPV